MERVRRFEGPGPAGALAHRRARADHERAPGDRLFRPSPQRARAGTAGGARSRAGGLSWDARRREDGRWAVRLDYLHGGRERSATWLFDHQPPHPRAPRRGGGLAHGRRAGRPRSRRAHNAADGKSVIPVKSITRVVTCAASSARQRWRNRSSPSRFRSPATLRTPSRSRWTGCRLLVADHACLDAGGSARRLPGRTDNGHRGPGWHRLKAQMCPVNHRGVKPDRYPSGRLIPPRSRRSGTVRHPPVLQLDVRRLPVGGRDSVPPATRSSAERAVRATMPPWSGPAMSSGTPIGASGAFSFRCCPNGPAVGSVSTGAPLSCFVRSCSVGTSFGSNWHRSAIFVATSRASGRTTSSSAHKAWAVIDEAGDHSRADGLLTPARRGCRGSRASSPDGASRVRAGTRSSTPAAGWCRRTSRARGRPRRAARTPGPPPARAGSPTRRVRSERRSPRREPGRRPGSSP